MEELFTLLPELLIPDLLSIPTFKLVFLGARFFKPSEGNLVPVNEVDMVGLRCVDVVVFFVGVDFLI